MFVLPSNYLSYPRKDIIYFYVDTKRDQVNEDKKR